MGTISILIVFVILSTYSLPLLAPLLLLLIIGIITMSILEEIHRP